MNHLLLDAPQARRTARPLLFDWTDDFGKKPVPRRWLRPRKPIPTSIVSRWLPPFLRGSLRGRTPPTPEAPVAGFDFSHAMQRVLEDVIARCEPFRGLDASRLLVTVTQARTGHAHGLFAKVTPLRFKGGEMLQRRGGRQMQVQRYRVADVELLYLVTFCLPRFLDQDFDEKLITICHELYHLDPTGNGDLRRHHGRCYMHTGRKHRYEAKMKELAEAYLATSPPREPLAFLHANFNELHQRHGGVHGYAPPMPRLVHVESKRPLTQTSGRGRQEARARAHRTEE